MGVQGKIIHFSSVTVVHDTLQVIGVHLVSKVNRVVRQVIRVVVKVNKMHMYRLSMTSTLIENSSNTGAVKRGP